MHENRVPEIVNSVGDPSILLRCASGQIIIIKRLLQHAGLYELIHSVALDTVSQEFDRETADKVASLGIEYIHEVLPASGFVSLVRKTEQNLSNILPTLYDRLLRYGFGYRKKIWVLKYVIMRYFIPHDANREAREDFIRLGKRHQGRLTTLAPHRDVWHAEPGSCINVWMAIGKVQPGNGLNLFPDDYSTPLKYIRHRGVTRDQPISRPSAVSMEPGDVLLFPATQLHSSKINTTNQTRCVLTVRLALEEPARDTSQPNRYRLVYPRYSSSFFIFPEKIDRILRKASRFLSKSKDLTPPDQTLLDISCKKESETMLLPPEEYCTKIPLSNIPVAKPFIISREYCLIRFIRNENEEVWRIRRRCPHEGADLALGYFKDESIYCPWHNLSVKVCTGETACKTLNAVESVQCRIDKATVLLPKVEK